MEDNKTLVSLRDKVEKELAAFTAKESLTPSDVEVAKNAVCLIKELDEVLMMPKVGMETSEGHHMSYGYYDPHMHGGYSYCSYGEPGRMYMYDDDHSMARGRSPITGRYVSRGMDGVDTSGRRYTFSYDTDPMYGREHEKHRDMGRSGHSIDDRIVDMLERMMDNEDSNYARNKINTIIRIVENMRGE